MSCSPARPTDVPVVPLDLLVPFTDSERTRVTGGAGSSGVDTGGVDGNGKGRTFPPSRPHSSGLGDPVSTLPECKDRSTVLLGESARFKTCGSPTP